MADIMKFMLTLRNQVKVYHWETMNFSRHKATDELVDKLDDNIDKFVEVFLGKYGLPKLGKTSLKIRDYHDKEAPLLLREAIDWLTFSLPKKLKRTDSDLLNIRDELLSDLNQTLYLFTLR
jgi:hypothetical protein